MSERKRARWIIGLLVAGGLAVAANATAADRVDLSVTRGDYGTALAILLPRAQRGDSEAEYRLAVLYGAGNGVPQDYLLRAAWCYDAAQRGYAPAQLLLARLYYAGIGVARDRVAAYVWANLAASRLPPGPELDSARQFRDFAKDQLPFPEIYRAQQMASAWHPTAPLAGPAPMALSIAP